LTKERLPVTCRTFGTVEKVRQFLLDANYNGEITITTETIKTVEDASGTVGAPPEEILKTLVLVADGEPVIAMMSGPNRIDLKKAKSILGSRKILLARPEWVREYSGFEVGGVPPVGFPGRPRALLDEDLFRFDTVWAAAGSDHAFFPVNPEVLQEYTGGKRSDIKKES